MAKNEFNESLEVAESQVQMKPTRSDIPKLMNGYGELFDYKDSNKAQLATEQIHQKKLNLEREKRKLKLQKKVEKDNYYKFKNTQKISYKSEKTSIRYKYRSESAILKEINKYKDQLIPISDFITELCKKINADIKQNYKISTKTLKSMRETDYPDEIINEKIEKYHAESIVIENKLVGGLDFYTNLKNDPSINELCNSKDSFINYIESLISGESESLRKEIVSKAKELYKAYSSQYYFEYQNKEFDFEGKMTALKETTKKEKQTCKENYKKSISMEKQGINKRCEFGIGDASVECKYDVLRIREKELSEEHNLLQGELKELTKEKQQKIKEIKKAEKELYKQDLAKYKEENKTSFSFWGNKKDAILNSGNTFSLRLMFNPRLSSLNKHEYKMGLNKVKANYWLELGKKLKEYTYDGEFLMKKSEALLDHNKNIKENTSKIKKQIEKIELKSSLSSMSAEDKEIYNAKKQDLKEKFISDKQALKERKLNKEITGSAYRNEKLKLTVFYEEDVKAIKLGLNSVKDKYQSKDVLLGYSKQNKLIKKEYAQANNDIAKEVPMEYKRNNSIWMTILAFFLPGVDSLILGKWKKAFWMLLLTVLCWAIFVPFAFGVYNIQGNGIQGLVKLSWQVDYSPVYGALYSDARYALVEGVIGVILLVISISYFIISAYQCWKITRSMEKGIRPNTWLETKKILRTSGFPYAISLPGLFLIAFIVVMPIVVSLLLAFTNIGKGHNPAAGQEANWVGFDQFVRIFSDSDLFKPLGHVLGWNIIWAISTTLLVLFLGTIMALAIENRNIKGKAVWRVIFILPWAIPAFVSILFFKVIFTPGSTGIMNQWLTSAGIIDKPIDWKNNVILARLIMILIQGWLGHSYVVLLISGNIKSISGDIYEAATIDGANVRKQFWKITFPIVLIQIAPLLIGQFTFNFNNFAIIWLFNDGGGTIDPEAVYKVGNCDILLSWIFKLTFSGEEAGWPESNQAIASALVIIMSFFIVTASGIGFARSKAFKRGEDI